VGAQRETVVTAFPLRPDKDDPLLSRYHLLNI
jgi:hypothetical protein